MKPNEKIYVTVSELEAQTTGPVYVLNNTKSPEQGLVVLTVPKVNGIGLDNVIVPSTFIPIDLLEQVSRKQLNESSEFKAAVRRKLLIPITKEYAEQLLDDDDAKHEIERLYNLGEATKNMAQALDTMQTGDMLHPEFANRAAQLTTPNNDTEDKVTPRVAAIVAKVLEDGDERGAISSLRMMTDLTNDDYTYIIKECGKKHTNLFNWASKRVG